MNRREFLNTAWGASAGIAHAQSSGDQSFLAGLAASGVAGAPRGASAGDEGLLRICDECSRLGLHYLEFNTTNRGLVESWDSRISQFRDEMAKRNLTLRNPDLDQATRLLPPCQAPRSSERIGARQRTQNLVVESILIACHSRKRQPGKRVAHK
ncbi:MAG: hypothetical protein ACRD44_01835 [Bryobacteraceae bacterium]